MDGEQRRDHILTLLQKNSQPIKGSELAELFGVSRQVIVQDIALLKANNKNILSTNKGYLLFHPKPESVKLKRTVYVTHTDQQIQDELYTIVDFGGTVLDVVIEHEIYGQITVDLLIKNRQDVDEFVGKITSVKDRPLKELTHNFHYHTIEAESENTLNLIEQSLREKGYIASSPL